MGNQRTYIDKKEVLRKEQAEGNSSWKSFGNPFGEWKNWDNPFAADSGVQHIQAKMEVSQPGDASELQADAVAAAVMRGDVEAAQLELQQNGAELSAKASGVTIDVPPGFEEQLQRMKGGGVPLDEEQQSRFEKYLGTKLDHVRLHTGEAAEILSRKINARAFAHGEDVFIPDTNDEELLAHELTHAGPQRNNGGLMAKIYRKRLDDDITDIWLKPGHGLFEKPTGRSKVLYIPANKYDKLIILNRELTNAENADWINVKSEDTGKSGWVREIDVHISGVFYADPIHVFGERIPLEEVDILGEKDVVFSGEPFRITVKIKKHSTVDGKAYTEGSTGFNFFALDITYLGNGYADHNPYSLIFDMNKSPFADQVAAHERDSAQVRGSVGMYPEKETLDWMDKQLSDPSVVLFSGQGVLPAEGDIPARDYIEISIVRIRTWMFFMQGVDFSFMLYHSKKKGLIWSPAEQLHSFSTTPYVPDEHHYYSNSYFPYNEKKDTKNEIEANAKSRYANSVKYKDLVVVPLGAIHKDQLGQIGLDNSHKPGERNVPLPPATAMTTAVVEVDDYIRLVLGEKSTAGLRQLLKTLKGRAKELESSSDATSDAFANNVLILIRDIKNKGLALHQMNWPGKGTDDPTAVKMQQSFEDAKSLYTKALENAYSNYDKSLSLLSKADRARVAFDNWIAGTVLAWNGPSVRGFYETREQYAQVDREVHEYYQVQFFISELEYSISRRMDATTLFFAPPVTYPGDDNYDALTPEASQATDAAGAMKLYNDISLYSVFTQLMGSYAYVKMVKEMDDDTWFSFETEKSDRNYLHKKLNKFSEILSALDTVFEKRAKKEAYDPNVIVEQLKAFITIVSDPDYQKRISEIYRKVRSDYRTSNQIIQIGIMLLAFIVAAFGGWALSLYIGTTGFAVAATTVVVEAFLFTTVDYGLQMAAFGKTDASFGEMLLTNIAMMGILKVASMGFTRFYKWSLGSQASLRTVEYVGGQAITSVVTLQGFNELLFRVKTGEWMSESQRTHSMMETVITMVGLAIAHRFIIEPLKVPILRKMYNSGQLRGTAKLKELGDWIDAEAADLKNTIKNEEAAGGITKETMNRVEALHNKERAFLLEYERVINDKENATTLNEHDRKKLGKAIKEKMVDAENAAREAELLLAQAGITIGFSPGRGLEFYPIAPGEVGFKESAKSFLKEKYGKQLKDKGHGVLVYEPEGQPSVLFLSEQAVETKLVNENPDVKAGLESYKKDKGKSNIFDVMESVNSPTFEGVRQAMLDYFKSNKRQSLYEIYTQEIVDKFETMAGSLAQAELFLNGIADKARAEKVLAELGADAARVITINETPDYVQVIFDDNAERVLIDTAPLIGNELSIRLKGDIATAQLINSLLVGADVSRQAQIKSLLLPLGTAEQSKVMAELLSEVPEATDQLLDIRGKTLDFDILLQNFFSVDKEAAKTSLQQLREANLVDPDATKNALDRFNDPAHAEHDIVKRFKFEAAGAKEASYKIKVEAFDQPLNPTAHDPHRTGHTAAEHSPARDTYARSTDPGFRGRVASRFLTYEIQYNVIETLKRKAIQLYADYLAHVTTPSNFRVNTERGRLQLELKLEDMGYDIGEGHYALRNRGGFAAGTPTPRMQKATIVLEQVGGNWEVLTGFPEL